MQVRELAPDSCHSKAPWLNNGNYYKELVLLFKRCALFQFIAVME
jgi:hypothetical protein